MDIMDVFVGIDIGGSHVSLGFVDHAGLILFKTEIHNDNFTMHPPEMVTLLSNSINDNKQTNWKVSSIGIGIPGQSKDNILVAASNLPNFKNVPLAAMMSKRHQNVPVLLLNDADAAICAEVWGNESSLYYETKKSIAMVTLGTGIGFALILNNSLYQGSNGLVEGGHMIVNSDPGARLCGCGQTGCVEVYSSAKNTAIRLQELDENDKKHRSSGSSNNLLDAFTSHPDSPVSTGAKEVFERYAVNDFNAVKVVEETAEHLAVFCLNICRVVDPDIIVFTGGMAKAGDVLLDLVRKHLKRRTWTCLPTDVVLSTARSIDAGGMVGAAIAGRRYGERQKAAVEGGATSATPLSKESVSSKMRRNVSFADNINITTPPNNVPPVVAPSPRKIAEQLAKSNPHLPQTPQAGVERNIAYVKKLRVVGSVVAVSTVFFSGATLAVSGDDKGKCPLGRYLQYAQLATSIGFGLYLLMSQSRNAEL